ncbi:hypothetical protein [Roseivivax jejudonensis]|uniref:hypothetical protein n=1 Tax=Roseivivax jejudonensis TaxID=1529041 RepID=UPI00117BB8C0|nr:hypothetical protein [Roseivivax jejudonensis]
MSDTSILETLPESLELYLGSKRTQTAVDTLLGTKPNPPGDFDWKKMDFYYSAVLSAHQVRCEYAKLLSRTFREIWSCDLIESRFRQLSVVDSMLSVETVWTERQLSMLFGENGCHPEYTLEFSVYAWPDEGIRIYASLVHSSKPTRELLKLPRDNWTFEDGELWTHKGAHPFGAGKAVPINELKQKASVAIEVAKETIA